MTRVLSPRRTGEIILAMTLVAGFTAGTTSGAYAATPFPEDGARCSYDQIDDEVYKINSAEVTPVVTQFTSTYVAVGTTSAKTYTLSVSDRVSTEVTDNDQNTSGNNRQWTRNNSGGTANNSSETQSLLQTVSNVVGFTVQTETASTSTESNSASWAFGLPGYYGIYKGTQRVTGSFTRAVCSYGFWSSPSWHEYGGTFSTFDHIEEGTVGCGDKLDPKTVRRAAQLRLGCAKAPSAAQATKTTGKSAPKNVK